MKDEEFSRGDPGKYHKSFWVTLLRWTVPAAIVLIGIGISTQRFAVMMNFDPSVVGYPLFITKPFFIIRGGYEVYNPLVFILSAIKYMFNAEYSYYFMQAIPPALISIVIAIFILFILGIISSHQENQHIHGTARWAYFKELKENGFAQRYGVVCGEKDDAPVGYRMGGDNKEKLILYLKNSYWRKYITKQPAKVGELVCHSGATNTWVIAPTRSGKGVSCVITTCLNYGIPYWAWEYNKKSFLYDFWGGSFRFFTRTKKVIKGRGSMVIFDPKGENFEASAGFRSQFSTILPFNPMQIKDSKGKEIGTVHYNPIHEIPDDEMQAFAWADMFGQFFFSEGGDGENAFFYKNARDIFTGVVMHVRFSKKIPWEKKTFTEVLNMFSMASNEGNAGQGEEEEEGCGMAMIAAMQEDGVHVHDDGTPFKIIHDLVVKAGNRSMAQTAKERGSIFSTVFSEINYFQDPLIEEVTRYSDFSVRDFLNSKNGITLYLIIPYNHLKRISPLFRLLVNFIIRNFSEGATNANSQKLAIPCLFLLDEFPALGKFEEIEENAGVLAGYGVTFLIISQSIGQIEKIYGEHHAFLDHCKTVVVYTPGNSKDAKQFSEAMGNRSVLLDNISSSGGKFDAGWNNVSRSSQEQAVSLINPDELMKLEFNRAIIINQGLPPYKAKKVVYYEDYRFMHKAFKPYPKIDKVYSACSRLPSHRRKHPVFQVEDVEKTIKEIKAFEVDKVIPGNMDIFGGNVG